VHPGGPFWARKDAGAWSIPKGEAGARRRPIERGRREFQEETGLGIDGDFRELAPVRQPAANACTPGRLERDLDADAIHSNSFEMEWPPRSGQRREFPEVDRAAWFDLPTARNKITKGPAGLCWTS